YKKKKRKKTIKSKGTFAQFFDLQHYPFDCHRLRFHLDLTVDTSLAQFSTDHIKVSMTKNCEALGVGGTDWDQKKKKFIKLIESTENYTFFFSPSPIPSKKKGGVAIVVG
ncbi:hypothetical protein RFI_25539, partial [Reticulomyxa filosa]